jgi:MoaA/NifB/PqqE/SkfB family radical SAM enzyme
MISESLRDAYGYTRPEIDQALSNLLDAGILRATDDGRGIDGVDGMYYPMMVTLELCDACNFSCPFCYKEKGPRATYLPKETAFKVIDSLCAGTKRLELIGGEPTMHPDFDEIVGYANSRGMSVYLVTNGSRLSKLDAATMDGIASVQVSLYGLSAEEYEDNTGRDCFDSVMSGLGRLNDEGRNYTVSFTLSGPVDLDRLFSFLEDNSLKRVRFGFTFQTERSEEMPEETLQTLSYRILEASAAHPGIEVVTAPPEKESGVAGFSRETYFRTASGSPSCDAFAVKLCISEEGRIKPCTSLPNEYSVPLDRMDAVIREGWVPGRELFDGNPTIIDHGCSILKRIIIDEGRTDEARGGDHS